MKKNKCDCPTCTSTGCRCAGYARFFAVLGNQNRLHIIQALKTGPKSVTGIIEETGLEQTCVSHCLGLLQRNGFVTVQRKGKFRIYALNATAVLPLLARIDAHIDRYALEGTA